MEKVSNMIKLSDMEVKSIAIKAAAWQPLVGTLDFYPFPEFGSWFAFAMTPGAEVGDKWVYVALHMPMNQGGWPSLENGAVEVEDWTSVEMCKAVEDFFSVKFYNRLVA